MFLFNISYCRTEIFNLFKYILCFYSMVRHLRIAATDDRFKYILCFYSIGHRTIEELKAENLNTSYVSIQ